MVTSLSHLHDCLLVACNKFGNCHNVRMWEGAHVCGVFPPLLEHQQASCLPKWSPIIPPRPSPFVLHLRQTPSGILTLPLVGYPSPTAWSLNWHAPSYVACSSLIFLLCLHQLAPLTPHPGGSIIYFDHVHSKPIFT